MIPPMQEDGRDGRKRRHWLRTNGVNLFVWLLVFLVVLFVGFLMYILSRPQFSIRGD